MNQFFYKDTVVATAEEGMVVVTMEVAEVVIMAVVVLEIQPYVLATMKKAA